MLKGENNKICTKYWNWDITGAKYSKDLIASIDRYVKKLFKLLIKIQNKKSKEIFQVAIEEKLSVSIAKTQLKTLCLPGDAITLIVNSAIMQHAIKTGTLDMHDLNGFHHLID